MKKRHDGYQIVAFPRMRRLMITIGRVSSHKHTIRGLVELDVTKARQLMREHKASTGEDLSFTAYLAACVGQAVAMNPEVQAYRTWRSQLVLFDDVDIHIQVERDLRGQKFPVPHIVRGANTKTIRDIHEEIRTVQAQPTRGREVKALPWMTLLPSFARQFFLWLLFKNPRLIHTLGIVVGGIAERPALVDGKVEAHEYLCVTLDFDHDLIDGAPAARFTQQLCDLIESGSGLGDSTLEWEQARARGTSKKS